jgi:hypothetical protein
MRSRLPSRVVQPKYITVMWVSLGAISCVLQTVMVFSWHTQLGVRFALQVALFVVGFGATAISNKINFGVYRPGAKSEKPGS